MNKMPKWADAILIPVISIILAAAISGAIILAIGENPWEALKLMIKGSMGSAYGWDYTLFYATNYIFTGLAVAVAFHAQLFNIGGEGQALLGGLGVALVCLFVPWPHWSLALIGAMFASAAFGAAWMAIPAWLQAKRGSHIVITTIMFNFIGASLLTYMLGQVLKPKGSQESASALFPDATHLPSFHDMLGPLGIAWSKTAPANIMFPIAIVACIVVWLMIWHSRLGYEIRAFGKSERGAKYAGISPSYTIMIALLISGALAGMMAVNQTMGEGERLVLNASGGAGFIGISVALMGRGHPLGIFFAAILFGALQQGGSELDFFTNTPVQIIVMIQALVILFTGALDNMVRMPLEKLFLSLKRQNNEETQS